MHMPGLYVVVNAFIHATWPKKNTACKSLVVLGLPALLKFLDMVATIEQVVLFSGGSRQLLCCQFIAVPLTALPFK
eukprot:365810-Chlamydomonas_euryale.AAC.18